MTDTPSPPEDRLRTEANLWAIRLTDDPDDTELKDTFASWYAQSPSHKQAWAETLRVWALTGHIPPEFVTLPPADTGTGNRRKRRPGQGRTLRRRAVLLSLAAAYCVAGWLLAPSLQIALLADHRTATGQNNRITLADGSVVTLGGKSAVAIHYDTGKREVTLLRGEAFFEVRHDTRRPFHVAAGTLRVRDIGTRFDVRMDPAQIRIDVQDGQVGVSRQDTNRSPEIRLGIGDELCLDRQTGGITRAAVAPEMIGSWRNGTLVVDNDTIDHVVATLQRYYPGFILTYTTDRNTHRVGGIYDLNNIPAALRAVLLPSGGQVHELGKHVLVLTSAGTGGGH